MSQERYDVVVVGSGVIGSSIAYHLARKQLRVAVLERGGIAEEPVASWASAGGVRRQGRHTAEARLASESIARWETLEQELDADLQYRQGGNLFLAETDDEAQQLVAFVCEQQTNGFGDVRLLDRQEVHALVPALSAHIVAGSYSPQDGQADPPRTTRAFAIAAQRLGAIYLKNTPVSSLLLRGGHIVGVNSEHGTLYSDHVVLAAGAWSDEIAASIGLRLPVRMEAPQMLLSSPAEVGMLRPVLGTAGRLLSLKQLSDGSFLLGGGWSGDPTPDRRHYTLRPASVQGNWEVACAILPGVKQQRVVRSWCGLEAVSIDDIPFIGPVAGLTGLTLALGFSGHGFAISPAVGRCVADQIAGLAVPELAGLSPARIASFSHEHIEAFVNAPL
jgi:glycine/D-amino acid oxidase-like deaminating enzyme